MPDKATSVTDLRCPLPIIRRLSTTLVVMGSVSAVSGVPTVVLAAPIPSIPFITGSGVWTGAMVIIVGVLGLMLAKEAIKERSPKLKWLAIAVQITSIFTTQLAVLHTAWNVWGLIACLTNPDPGPHFAAQCHVNNAGISVQASYGILVGIGMAATCVVTSICSSAVVRAIKSAEREERTEVIV